MSTDPDSGHDYDGIREYDNPLPNWWLTVLYASVVFGFGYWMFYQVFGGTSLAAQVKKDEAAAAARVAATAPVTDDLLIALSHDAETNAKAKTIFLTTCAQCHLADGSGKIGPNLTDEYWLHGDKPSDIYKTITTGSVAKGMPAWGPLLGPEKIKLVASYIVTLKNTNKPGKAPEGQKVN